MITNLALGVVLNVASTSRKPASKKNPFVIVNGVKYPMLRDPISKVFRVRKRTKDIKVDFSTGLLEIEAAKKKAKETLETEDAYKQRRRHGGATLQEVADAYKTMPKRCTPETAGANINRWEKILLEAWGKTLGDVRAGDFTGQLWSDYAAKRQGGKLNLSTRTHQNRGINSALRMGVSLFHKGLEERYQRAGIALNFEAIRRVEWLPEIAAKLPKLEQENIDALMKALIELKATDRPKWRAVMIARFSGLRSREVSGAHKTWLIKNAAGAWCFEVRDRPEEKWWHKTGEDYTAPILSAELVEDLLACPDEGALVPVVGSRDHFFRKVCNRWLRQFIPRPNKGMHRLRALYAEALRDATVNAVLLEQAQKAGIEEARKALGHTTSKTTERSYLPTAV